MADLKTTYLGLTLKNPVIVGSSTHTATAEKVKALEDAGAAAVVMKSIFEEQVRVDVEDLYGALEESPHPAAYEYLRADLPMRVGPDKYLDNLSAIKAAAGIPVIASINCVNADKWVTFAKKIEAAGADALEMNIYDIPESPDTPAAQIEERHLNLVKAIKAEVNVPVAVKIGPFYSSIMEFTRNLSRRGADALVLFNRFFQPDIDIDSVSLRNEIDLSRPEDIRLPLRWVAILRDMVSCDICLSTGVHGADGAVKAILAGANAVQVCSALYKNGVEHLTKIIDGLDKWMDAKGYVNVDAFRGALREKDITDKRGFERAQYVKAFVGLE